MSKNEKEQSTLKDRGIKTSRKLPNQKTVVI